MAGDKNVGNGYKKNGNQRVRNNKFGNNKTSNRGLPRRRLSTATKRRATRRAEIIRQLARRRIAATRLTVKTPHKKKSNKKTSNKKNNNRKNTGTKDKDKNNSNDKKIGSKSKAGSGKASAHRREPTVRVSQGKSLDAKSTYFWLQSSSWSCLVKSKRQNNNGGAQNNSNERLLDGVAPVAGTEHREPINTPAMMRLQHVAEDTQLEPGKRYAYWEQKNSYNGHRSLIHGTYEISHENGQTKHHFGNTHMCDFGYDPRTGGKTPTPQWRINEPWDPARGMTTDGFLMGPIARRRTKFLGEVDPDANVEQSGEALKAKNSHYNYYAHFPCTGGGANCHTFVDDLWKDIRKKE